MDSIVAVVGTLLGAALGVIGSYLTQRVAYSREASERLAVTQRQVFVKWLDECQGVFDQVRQAWVGDPPPPAESRWRDLQVISSAAAQSALENVRLVSNDEVATSAAALWTHLRREGVAVRGAGTKDAYVAWREKYWALRRQFVDASRRSLGLAALNWDVAGVPAPPASR